MRVISPNHLGAFIRDLFIVFIFLGIYNFKIGYNYPIPIVDAEKSRKFASETLWRIQKKQTVHEESKRILKQHTFNEKR